MDLFKTQFDRILKQINALTPSQKMLTASMVAIIVMTLLWWGRYAGEPDMEPLLPQAISADELARVEIELDAKGIKHVVSGDKILVPADRKLEAVAGLMYSHALPRSAKDGFDEVLKNINPFMSVQQSNQMWNRGKELTISRLIAEFPDVADAHVMIDPTREVRIGGGVDPSATVTITMRNGAKAPQQLVDAAADVVMGAQSSLPRNKIKVVVDGFPRKLKQDNADSNGLDPDDQQEMIQRSELRLEDKIKNQLSYINGLMVSVTVKLNTTRIEGHSETIDPKSVIQKEIETQSKTSETTGAVASGGEPGTSANTSLSVNQGAASAGTGATSTTDDQTSKFTVIAPKSEEHRITPAGDTTPVAAAVRVPLAYFAAIYVRDNPGVKDPTETQMRPMIDDQLARIHKDVMLCTALKDEAEVAVNTYVDPTPVLAASPATSAGISGALMMGWAY